MDKVALDKSDMHEISIILNEIRKSEQIHN